MSWSGVPGTWEIPDPRDTEQTPDMYAPAAPPEPVAEFIQDSEAGPCYICAKKANSFLVVWGPHHMIRYRMSLHSICALVWGGYKK